MPQEIELKLAVDPRDVLRLRDGPILRASSLKPTARRRLVNTYYDTPSFSFLRNGIMPRVRKIGRKRVQSVKMNATESGGLARRTELESSIRGDRPDLMQIVDPDVRWLLQERCADSDLVPILATDVVRETWLLKLGGSRVEHHSESPEAMFAHIPGVKVVMPSSPARACGLLLSAIRDPDPIVFLEPTRLYRASREDVPDDSAGIPLGQCFTLRTGQDVTIVAWGAMIKEVLEAADQLAAENVEAEVIDVATLKPLDSATILASVGRTGRLVIEHEAPMTCGYGAEIAARVAGRAMTSLLAPIERVTGYDTIMPYARMEAQYLPKVGAILAAVRRAMAFT